MFRRPSPEHYVLPAVEEDDFCFAPIVVSDDGGDAPNEGLRTALLINFCA
jgi:hypothetical protein